MTVGLSSLDKPLGATIALGCQYFRGVLTGSLPPSSAGCDSLVARLDGARLVKHAVVDEQIAGR